MKIVVVSPHRDDAAFSLGLTVERWLASGHTLQILNCFTNSEHAPYSDAGSLHANDRASFASAVRKREDVAWNKLLGGRLQFTDLGLLDAPLRLACSVDEVLTVEVRPGDRAVSRVAGSLAKTARVSSPEKLAFVLPLAVGAHIDHRVVRQAGLEALSHPGIPIAFYEDLPYAARPDGAESIPILADALPAPTQPVFGAPVPDDLQGAVQRKRRIAECYDSQIDSVVVAEIAAFCLQYEGRERLWANAAWAGSAMQRNRSGAEPG